jgi:hypothetical protein
MGAAREGTDPDYEVKLTRRVGFYHRSTNELQESFDGRCRSQEKLTRLGRDARQ